MNNFNLVVIHSQIVTVCFLTKEKKYIECFFLNCLNTLFSEAIYVINI